MRDTPSILPLSVQRLCFETDGKRLLEDVSFTLPGGGVTTIIGPNGAGKSLTLRLCHGLLTPTSGTVHWGAAPGAAVGRKRHAMVFQRPIMLRRSVRANLVHALSAVGAADAALRVTAALERFGLNDIAERPARLLSGGEQQRLAIARAWSLSPEVLFLDEPTSQLDPGATRQIEGIIASLASEGMTILMTTHDLGQARRLGVRILLLNKGRLIEDAATARFFAAPGTREGQAFIAGELLW
ncbi:MAG TPA: ATP-binding cassette domain-containing protein [Beijerinckiaceae bacterium]|nr:ATP-binding cassette domain-containing protein [Beijerinckiaceae bacterium]